MIRGDKGVWVDKGINVGDKAVWRVVDKGIDVGDKGHIYPFAM